MLDFFDRKLRLALKEKKKPKKKKSKKQPTTALLSGPWKTIVETLLGHKLGYIFGQPVDPVALGIPDYFDRIQRPMDLGTIRDRLDSGDIATPEAFADAVRTVFTNATTYNADPENEVHRAATTLLDEFEAEWALEQAAAEKRRSKIMIRKQDPPAEETATVDDDADDGDDDPMEVDEAPQLGGKKEEAPRNWASSAAAPPSTDFYEGPPKMGEGELSAAAGLLEAMRRIPGALSYFGRPVDPVLLNLPDYTSVITKPMDLGTVSKKLAGYSSVQECADDLRLIFRNAVVYNVEEKNPVRQCAVNCDKQLEAILFERDLDDLSAADREAKRARATAVERMRRAVHDLKRREASKLYFNAPVDLALYPDYADKIVDPIDLATIDRRLVDSDDSYPDAEAFAADLRRVFDNAMTYTADPKMAVHAEAKKLKAAVDGVLKRYGIKAQPQASAAASKKAAFPSSPSKGRFGKNNKSKKTPNEPPGAQPVAAPAEDDDDDNDDNKVRVPPHQKPPRKGAATSSSSSSLSPSSSFAASKAVAPLLVKNITRADEALKPLVMTAEAAAENEEHDSVFGDGEAPLRIIIAAPPEVDEEALQKKPHLDWAAWGRAMASSVLAGGKRPDDDDEDDERLKLLWAQSRSTSLARREREVESERLKQSRIAEARLAAERHHATQLADLERRRLDASAAELRRREVEAQKKKDAEAFRAAARAKARRERERVEQTVDLEKQRTTVSSFLDTIDANGLLGFDHDDDE